MHRFIVAILLLAAPHGAFAATGELSGALFAAPNFIPLGKAGAGIGWGPSDDTGTLGDVDGDGDLDLVVAWTRRAPQWGWMVASNDGLGDLVPTHNVTRPSRERPGTPIISIWGDDFDRDGLLDLAFEEGLNLELWHNRGEDGFATILQLTNAGFIGLADGEGDGDVDLLVMEYDAESLENHEGPSQATLWYNDGDAAFIRSDRFTLDSEEGLWARLWPAERSLGAGGAARLLWLRSCWEFEEAGPTGVWLTQPWAASAEPPLFFESMVNPCYSTPLQADRDGQVDLVGIAEVTETPFLSFHIHTSIPLSVPNGAEAVDVAIYNLLGQLVRQVWSGPLAAGEHRLTWDGRDGQGRPVASGAYLYQVRVSDQLRTRKMVKLE